MSTPTTTDPVSAPLKEHPVVSQEVWLAERKKLLAREKELTHLQDEVNEQRRALPWVRVEKDYVFDTQEGPKKLADLFQGRNQLMVYHFMLTPGDDHLCRGCSLLSDHVDAARQHFEHADLSFIAISRAPLSQIDAVKKRMGWKFKWVSSGNTDFNYDFGVSFRPGQEGKQYNYAPLEGYDGEDLHGTSVFVKNQQGEVFHTYSCYARGNEKIAGVFSYLDLVPKGRNEQSTMSWVELHDEYEKECSDSGCCC